MITALLTIYFILYMKSRMKISKIKNRAETAGKVSGFEIKVDSKKKWTRDVVSFYVDKEMFTGTKTSSPFYLKSKSPIGTDYKVIYNTKNPADNIIIDNTFFTQIRYAIFAIASVYVVSLIALIVRTTVS